MSAVRTTEAMSREVARIVQGVPTSDGAGVQLTRVIGSPELNMLDPFLLLDQFESDDANDYIGGFPAHPHRGFETVTYLLDGRMRHKDNAGNEGVIESGGVQWMTAGRGIVHSEMPEQEDGLLKGFQLWVNLPAKYKMTKPAYQEVTADQLGLETQENGNVIKVIAGKTDNGTTGPIVNRFFDINYMDVSLQAGNEFSQQIPKEHNAFIYVLEGEVRFSEQGQTISEKQLGVLTQGDYITLQARDKTRLLLASAETLDEPVARGGPFVMNSKEEVLQAFEDFRSNKL